MNSNFDKHELLVNLFSVSSFVMWYFFANTLELIVASLISVENSSGIVRVKIQVWCTGQNGWLYSKQNVFLNLNQIHVNDIASLLWHLLLTNIQLQPGLLPQYNYQLRQFYPGQFTHPKLKSFPWRNLSREVVPRRTLRVGIVQWRLSQGENCPGGIVWSCIP